MYDKFLSVVSSFNLTQVVSEPTLVVNSTSTLIDLVFVSHPSMVHVCETVPPLGNSDHLGLQFIMSTKLHKSTHYSERSGDTTLQILTRLQSYSTQSNGNC